MCRRPLYLMLVVSVLCTTRSAWADLVGYWRLDDGFGAAATDSSGNGHEGILAGNPEWVAGVHEGALQFAGAPDRVVIPYSGQLNPGDAFTVIAWANADTGGSGRRSVISSCDDLAQRGYVIEIDPDNTWQFRIGTGGNWNTTQGPTAAAGEWTHVAAAYL